MLVIFHMLEGYAFLEIPLVGTTASVFPCLFILILILRVDKTVLAYSLRSVIMAVFFKGQTWSAM